MTDLPDGEVPRTRSAAHAARSGGSRGRVAARRVKRARTPLQWVTTIVGELLLTAGVVVLLFVAWQLLWTDVVANRQQAQVVTQLEYVFADPDKAQAEGEISAERLAELRDIESVAEGDAWGLMRVPRLGADWERPLVRGVDLRYLNHGVGHYPDTQLPGEDGNFAVAGHRTTWGRPFFYIEQMQEGDPLIVETVDGYYVYRYARHRIVMPDATEILAPVPDQPGKKATEGWLTITACHPKFSAQERWIAYAKFDKHYSRSEGLPSDITALMGDN